jgi:hypothetical protein
MDILEHDPVTVFVTNVELGHGDNILTLSQSDLMEHFSWIISLGSSKLFYSLDWVSTW